jgi:hypothetical protein
MARRHHLLWLALALSAAAPAVAGCSKATSYSAESAMAAPEPPAQADHWVNGKPLSLAEARGNVVLVEAWHRQ